MSQGETTTAADITITPCPKDGRIKAKITKLKKGESVFLYDTKERLAIPLTWTKKAGTLKISQRITAGSYRLLVEAQTSLRRSSRSGRERRRSSPR